MAILYFYGVTYTRSQLVSNVALETLELGFFLGRGDDTGVRRLIGQPGVLALARLHYGQHLSFRHGQVDLAKDVSFTAALDKHGESVKTGFTRRGAHFLSCQRDFVLN